MRELIRTWTRDQFTLHMFDTGQYDRRGQTVIAFELWDTAWSKDSPVFNDSGFCGSPLNADDSDATVAALLGFLSLQAGDTDADYFNDYTEKQIAWRDSRAGELGLFAFDLEEGENDS